MARILIVDDCTFVLRALELAIKRMGHEAIATSDPVLALGAAMVNPPDLVIVDFTMPILDGAELLRQLHEALGSGCPRAIFVSAIPREDIVGKLARDLPVAGFVRKPFTLSELDGAVRKGLESSGHPVQRDALPERQAG